MWLLMRDQIEKYMRSKSISTYHNAEIAVDELKGSILKSSAMGTLDCLPLFFCYACQYGWNMIQDEDPDAMKKDRCIYCPLDNWEADKCYSNVQVVAREQGLYYQLCQAVLTKDYAEQKNLCEIIANLPVKAGVTTGTDNTGVSTKISAIVRTLKAGESYTYVRTTAFRKIPIDVLIRTSEGYENNIDTLSVAYETGKVIITNKGTKAVEFLVVDPDNDTLYATAVALSVNANGTLDRTRDDNLKLLPPYVLVKESEGRYAFNSKDISLSLESNSYRVFNNTSKKLTLLCFEQSALITTELSVLRPKTKRIIGRNNAFVRKIPIILYKDEDDSSKTFNTWIPLPREVQIVVSNDAVTIYNNTNKLYNIMTVCYA